MSEVNRKRDSFYLTAVTPSLECNGECEFAIPLPSDLIFAEHDSWYVGVAALARQQQSQEESSKSMRTVVTGKPSRPRNLSMKFWIQEDAFTSLDAPPSFIMIAKTWGDKIYSITVDNVTATLSKGNYTLTSFIETLSKLFNDTCLEKSIHLKIEVKTDTIVIQRTSANVRPAHVIEFSDHLVSLLHITHKRISISGDMWSTLIPHATATNTPPLLQVAPTTSATGTFELPVTKNKYTITVSEKPPSTKAMDEEGRTNITVARYDIDGGTWTFDLFADYLNSILAAHSVVATMSKNYVYQSRPTDTVFGSIRNIFHGSIKFKKQKKYGTSVTIMFGSALKDILNWSAGDNPFSLFRDDEEVECFYNITVQRTPQAEEEFEFSVNLNKDTDADICQSLNEVQKDRFKRHVPFFFDGYKKQLTFSLPPHKHEFSQFTIRFDNTLTNLLGLAQAATSLSTNVDSYLSRIYIRRPSFNTDSSNSNQHLNNTVYWIYTDIINDAQITIPWGFNNMDDKYKLLRVLTYADNSENNAIYPVQYIPLARHRISAINFKVLMNSANTSPIIMTLHFARGV